MASAVALTVTAVLLPAGSAAADPLFVGWSAVLPPLATHYDPSSSNACVAGRVSCVRATIRKMRVRFDPLAQQCDHDAVFGLAYLRTTEEYLQSTLTDGFFEKPRLVNHEDAAFAQMYFGAYDDWQSGRIRRVPPAWRVAFQAADDRQVSGSGDLLLGMNAHVNRDLPFVLAATGLVAPDGTSRKPDHDKINVMLNAVVEPLIDEEAARFDPDIAAIPATPYGVGYAGLLQLLQAWRQAAWEHAEELVAAPDDAARDVVAQEIEDYAADNARVLVEESAYVPPLTTTAARDAYCAANGNPQD